MAIFLFSTNMKLKKLVEDATSWWAEWDYNFDRIDSHDHSPNKGKQLGGASLTANDDYYFGSVTINQDTSKNFLLLGEKAADPNPAISANRGYIYVKEDAAGKANLFYYDEDRNVIQITREGSIVSGPIRVWDIPKAFELKLTWNETGVADQALNFKVNAGDRTLDMSGNLTVAATSAINQDVKDSASPTFASIFVSDAGTKKLEIDCTDAANAANRKLDVKVNDADRVIDLSNNLTIESSVPVFLNQDLTSDASPTFAGMTFGAAAQITLNDNSANALQIGSAGALDIVKFVTTDAAEKIVFADGKAHTATNAAPSTDTELTNKKYVDDSIGAHNEFKELTDVTGAYTTSYAIYRVNVGKTGLEELTTVVTEPGANNFKISKGTSDLDVQADLTVEADSVVNQDLSSDASPLFAGLKLAEVAAPTGEANKGIMYVGVDNNLYYRTEGDVGVQITSGSALATTILDTGTSYVLSLLSDSTPNFTANHSLTLDLGNTDRTLAIKGSAAIDQDVQTTASPTFVSPILTSLKLYDSDKSNTLEVIYNTNAAVDRVLNVVTSATPVTLTLGASVSLNQDLTTSSSPEFATLKLPEGAAPTGVANKGIIYVDASNDLYYRTEGDVAVQITAGIGLATSIIDSGTSYKLLMASNSTPDFTADRYLTFDLGNASRSLAIKGSSAIDQDVQTTASPTFVEPLCSTSLVLTEQGGAPASVANKGKLYVDSSNDLYYRTENATSVQITSGDSIVGGSGASESAYGRTDNPGSAIGITFSTVSGKTRITLTGMTYTTGINPGKPYGMLEVMLDAEEIPRYCNDTITTGAYYTEVNSSTIDLDQDYSGFAFEIGVRKKYGSPDVSSTNSARIALMYEAIVGTESGCSHSTLAAAIAAVSAGARILVNDETFSITGAIATVNKDNITIEGKGRGSLFDGDDSGVGITISNPGCVIKNIKLKDFTTAIDCNANYAMIVNNWFESNTTDVDIAGGPLSIVDGNISE